MIEQEQMSFMHNALQNSAAIKIMLMNNVNGVLQNPKSYGPGLCPILAYVRMSASAQPGYVHNYEMIISPFLSTESRAFQRDFI